MSVISTYCPSIDVNLQHHDIKLISPNSVQVRQWVSTSYSNNQATFSCPPPSTNIFMDRCVLMAQPFTVTYAGTLSSGSTLLQAGYDALRAYPIASIVNSHQLTINNQTFVIQTSELIPYMARFWKQSKFSNFPSMLDNYQVYADGVGAINNPLGQYFNAIDHHQPRGGFPLLFTTNNTTAGVISGTIYEPVWIPLLHKEIDQGLGLSNVRTFDLSVNFNSNLSRIVSHATSTATFSSVSVALGQPSLYMIYSSQPVGYAPRPLSYTTEDLNRFITPLGSALTSNSSTTIASTNMQLNVIPKYILVFVRESNANLTYASTDTACNISAVSINFSNVSGILSSCSEETLYNISVANGLQDTWEQWHGIIPNLATNIGTTGSFLKLFFGKDIMLQPGDYPGKIGAFNLQLNVTCKNVNQSASIAAPVLYVITSAAQKVIIHEGGQVESILGISGKDGEYVSYHNAMKHYGGSFFGWIKKAIGWLKKNKVISTIGSIAAPILSAIPQTAVAGPIVGTLTQGAKNQGFGDGEGGRIMSRRDLMSRVRKLR